MNSDIFFFAKSPAHAEPIVGELKNLLGENGVSIVLNETSQSNEVAADPADPVYENKTGIGTSLGGIFGLGAGAALGWTLLGPLLAIGPLVAAIGAATVGGTTGGLLGAMVGAGIPEHEARKHHDKIVAGSVLVVAHAHNHEERRKVKAILKNENIETLTADEVHVTE